MKTKMLILFVLLNFTGFSCKQNAPVLSPQPEIPVQTAIIRKMITAKVYIKPGKESDFISAAKLMVENSNKEEGCLSYMLYQDPYVKTNFIFVESYKDQAAIDFHFATTYFSEFGAAIGEMVSQPTEIKILDISGEK